MSDDRPAKRIRQACEQCRRKKSKCSGDRPVCSTCWRLEQHCYYNGESLQLIDDPAVNVQSMNAAPYTPAALVRVAGCSPNLDDRMATLESTVHRILDTLQSNGGTDQFGDRYRPSPGSHSMHDSIVGGRVPPLTAIISSHSSSRQTRLMHRERIEKLGEAYLTFCADQPLPLFQRHGFVESLLDRADVTLFAIIASSLRNAPNSEDAFYYQDSLTFRDAAQARVMADIGRGNVGLSTLQALCLIVFYDFANGQMKTASSLMAMTSTFALNDDHWTSVSARSYATEERTHCYWSIVLLRRLLGIPEPPSTAPNVRALPYPSSCTMPTSAVLRPEVRQAYAQSKDDDGVMVFVIEMSAEWVKVMSYVKDCLACTPDVSPWLTSSRYAAALAGVMSIETRLQPLHRYKHIVFRDLTLEDLEGCREYWAPWLLSRFLYHTMICLLNHPLLVTLQLQAKGNDSELFREQSSFYVARHVHWVLHFIAFIEARKFRVTDPIIGYCAAVTATIESQLIYSVDEATAEKKRRNIESCRRLIRSLATSHPSMADLDRKLGDLSEVISSTYTSNMNSTSSVSVDLARIRDILDICPHSSNRPTSVFNDEDPLPESTVPNGRSPRQWVRLSRRPSVDQPDEGAPLPRIDDQTRSHDFIMPPPTSVATTNSHAAFAMQDLVAANEVTGFPAELFFNGISQDASSWWNAFETYDPDRPGF